MFLIGNYVFLDTAFAPLYKLKLKTGSRRASVFKSPWSEVSDLWNCQTKRNNSYQLKPYIKYVKIRLLMSTIFFQLSKYKSISQSTELSIITVPGHFYYDCTCCTWYKWLTLRYLSSGISVVSFWVHHFVPSICKNKDGSG